MDQFFYDQTSLQLTEQFPHWYYTLQTLQIVMLMWRFALDLYQK